VAEARAYAVGEDFSALHAALSAGAAVKFVVATGSAAALQAASAAASRPAGSTSSDALSAEVAGAAAAAAELRLVKDVGLWALEQGSAFVASTAPAFDGGEQLRQALAEAAAFDGPALVLVLDPRAAVHAEGGGSLEASHVAATETAVSSGAWPLYRWDPRLDTEAAPLLSAGPTGDASSAAAPSASAGLSPALTVDSPCVLRDLEAFVDRYNQLSVLSRAKPEILSAAAGADTVQAGARAAQAEAEKTLLGSFKRLASAVGGDGGAKKQRLLVLYGSDGGNAAGVAKKLADEAGKRGFETEIAPADDVDPVRLVEERKLLFVVSTAGQGEQPLNSKEFVSRLQSTDQPMLDHLEMAVVALGDSHYWPRPDQGHYYNKAGKDVFSRLDALGASPLAPLCLCDEQDDDGYEEALREWIPTLWEALNVPDEDAGADDDEGASGAPASGAAHRSDEDIKRASNFLRGTLATSLEDPTSGAIPFEDTKLTKFAGIYMQDERDYRTARRKAGLEPAYSFMIRARMPGGVVTADQWLTFDRLADTHGNGTFKLTTRQAFQLHGVIKRKLKPTIKAINARLMDTIAACGDVNRNIMVSALPQLSAIHKQVIDISNAVSTHLKPHAGSRAYHEVFLDRKLVAGGGMSAKEEDEPIYGPTYLPRKFKISFAVPPVNDVDVYAHCLNFVAVVDHDDEPEQAGSGAAVERKEGESDSDDAAYDDVAVEPVAEPAAAAAAAKGADIEDGFVGGSAGTRASLAAAGGRVIHAQPSRAKRLRGGRLVGFNVLVGGGMGTTHGDNKTFPRLAEPLCFVTPDQVIDVAEQCVAVQRDFGDRVNRKHARLKYTIDDRGIAWFRNEVETRLGWRLQEARPFEFTSRGDAYGWAAGEDGKLHLTLYVQNGRVRDDPSCTAKTALRKVAQLHPSLNFVLTANQNVVVSNVLPSMKRTIDDLLAEHGVISENLSGLRLNSVACVALPSEHIVLVAALCRCCLFVPRFAHATTSMLLMLVCVCVLLLLFCPQRAA
jgi:sulfite reductase beta subunit-like hemoprotein/flavodoxin